MSGWPEGLIPVLDYPYNYSGDSLFHSWMATSVIEGWIFDNSRSGYPFGTKFLDYPGSDSGSHLFIKLIGTFASSWVAALNLYFLTGFFLVFVSSYCVCRALGLHKSFSAATAGLYSFSPFHFLRIEHLFFTWYFAIPIFFYYALYIVDFVPTEVRPSRLVKEHVAMVSLVVIACFGVYYAFFGVIVIGTAGVFGSLLRWNGWSIKLGSLAVSFLVAGVLLNIAPNVLHQTFTGKNPEAVQRTAAQSEVFGLKLVQLIIPRADHRVSKLADVSHQYSSLFPLVNENSSSSLGFIGVLGVVVAFSILILSLAQHKINARCKTIALIMLVLFFVGTIGGIGSLFSIAITSSIRAWNRVSIFLGFGALLILFIVVQNFLEKKFRRKHIGTISVLIAFFLLVLGILDQTISPCRDCAVKIKAAFQADKNFIHAIEEIVPAESAIYQLPYMAFPEAAPLNQLKIYELASGFINSNSLRWSFGGMKGREGDHFYRALSRESLGKQIEVLKRLAFAGIYVDRRGYADNGDQVANELTDLLHSPPSLTRSDNKVLYFSLEGVPPHDFGKMTASQIMERAGYFADALGPVYFASLSDGIDFRRSGRPAFLKEITGLSGLESWGRWSDSDAGKSVRIVFNHKLPRDFELVLSGRSFGPNVGGELVLRIGNHTYREKLPSGMFLFNVPVELGNDIVTEIELVPPKPTSPQELGLGLDYRKLGIGLTTIKFR